jgi:hypothetical protein
MDEINTKEALAALPPGTVLREKNGDIGEWDGTVLAGTDGGWWSLDYVVAVFPLTVLYRPDRPDPLLATVDELERKLADADGAVDAALALHAKHVSRAPECVCLGCQMARLLRGEETR